VHDPAGTGLCNESLVARSRDAHFNLLLANKYESDRLSDFVESPASCEKESHAFLSTRRAKMIESSNEYQPSMNAAHAMSDSIACTAGITAIALLSPHAARNGNVAQLVVRNLPEDLVKALKQRAARNNRSAEQEHREILQAALHGPRRRSVAEVLSSMPNVGRDEDFARDQRE
jgi:antitoxin FitA